MLVLMALAAVCVASSTVVAASGLDKPYYDVKDAENLFREFTKKHEKVYDGKEYYERLMIFKERLQEINTRNEKYPHTVFKVNHFADLKPEELQLYRGFKLPNGTIEKVRIPDSPIAAPDELDWRKEGVVTHVKDQGNCGSCYIFSAVGNIEGQHAIKNKQCLALSEGQALDCLEAANCVDGGWMADVMNKFANKSGFMKEEDYPYNGLKGTCHEDPSKVVVKVVRGQVLDIPDETTLKNTLAEIGPLAVALDDLDFALYNSGILEPGACKKRPNHAVLLVGYGEENGKQYWILKNSWGKNWGESGYVRLQRGVNACGMGTSYTATATVA